MNMKQTKAMTVEQIVAITKFMNDNNGRVTMEEEPHAVGASAEAHNEWAAVGVYTLKYISTDCPRKQLHISLGGRSPIHYL